MKYFPFLFIFFVCQVQAQEDPALELSKKRYAEELQASKKKLIQSYDQAIQRAMTAGKLDLANALTEEKKTVDDGKEIVVKEEKKEEKKAVIPVDPRKNIIGKWYVNNSLRFEFYKDGTGKHFYGSTVYDITWSRNDNGTFPILGIPERFIDLDDKNQNTAYEVIKNSKTLLTRKK